MREDRIVLLPTVYGSGYDPAVLCSINTKNGKSRVSRLRQGDTVLFGDRDVDHLQITVDWKVDYNAIPLPSNRFLDYDGDWNYNYRLRERFIYHSSINYAFGCACTTLKYDEYHYSHELQPAGCVSSVTRLARRVYVLDDKIVYQQAIAFNPDIHGVKCKDPQNGWIIYPEEVCIDDEAWTWSDPQVIYSFETDEWFFPTLNAGTVITKPPIPYYWYDWALQNKPRQPVTDYEALSECFRNTVTKYTTVSSNNLANAVEFIALAKDIYTGNISSLFSSFAEYFQERTYKVKVRDPKTGVVKTVTSTVPKLMNEYGSHFVRKVLPEVWLKYRYLYNTTKSDAEDTVDYLLKEKYSNLYEHNNKVLRGNIDISLGTLRLKMRLTQKKTLAENITHMFDSVGLMPNLHNLWDMVPFSFVVDWFVPSFSNTLEDIDQAYLSELYRADELLVTVDEQWDINYAGFVYHVHYYRRYFIDECPQFEIYEGSDHTKGKTICKRVVDGISLIFSIGG